MSRVRRTGAGCRVLSILALLLAVQVHAAALPITPAPTDAATHAAVGALLERAGDVLPSALQAQLLDALATVLAPGGVLLYATCSILRRENAAQVEAFLARHPDFTLAPLDRRFGHDTGAGHQRLPGEGGMDGFFYARLVRAR